MTKKIDRRHNYVIVLDTETCPIDRNLDGVDPTNMLTYDIGYMVCDTRGNVYEARSYVISDIFDGESDRMTSAYYANKLPDYEWDLLNGNRELASFYDVREQIKADMKKYHITEVYAHNARFDVGALNRTQEYLTQGRYKYFFPFGTTICDTLKMARQVMGNMKTYRKFCERNGYLTKKGQIRFTAEICYRYLSNNPSFVERHTALEDVSIEKEIMAYCFRQKKKMDRVLYGKKSK